MCNFYLQHPPSCKWFDPKDVKCLLSPLGSGANVSSLTNFKLARQTATLLALLTAKHCSNLTLLCINNQILFLQCPAIFVPTSSEKTVWLGHLPSEIHTESNSNVNLCPVFYLKTHLHCTEPFWKRLDGFSCCVWHKGLG